MGNLFKIRLCTPSSVRKVPPVFAQTKPIQHFPVMRRINALSRGQIKSTGREHRCISRTEKTCIKPCTLPMGKFALGPSRRTARRTSTPAAHNKCVLAAKNRKILRVFARRNKCKVHTGPLPVSHQRGVPNRARLFFLCIKSAR